MSKDEVDGKMFLIFIGGFLAGIGILSLLMKLAV
jgi:hypothetical protein